MNQYKVLREYIDFTEYAGIPMYEAMAAWDVWSKYLDLFGFQMIDNQKR